MLFMFTSWMTGRLLRDLLGDIWVGESVLLGLMAPLVRMRDPLFLRRGCALPSSSAEPADPPEDPEDPMDEVEEQGCNKDAL